MTILCNILIINNLYSFYFADSGVESSTTYLGQDGGAISDCELTQSQSIDEIGGFSAPYTILTLRKFTVRDGATVVTRVDVNPLKISSQI